MSSVQQGSVATHLTFNDNFITNLLLCLTVKKISESKVCIWQSYGQQYSGSGTFCDSVPNGVVVCATVHTTMKHRQQKTLTTVQLNVNDKQEMCDRTTQKVWDGLHTQPTHTMCVLCCQHVLPLLSAKSGPCSASNVRNFDSIATATELLSLHRG